MKINLGAGNDIQKGYLNHDIRKHRDEIDLVFDLNDERWGRGHIKEDGFWSPGVLEGAQTDDTIYIKQFEEIRAHDVLEHLDSCINFLDNCWDLLTPTGVLDIKVCGYKNESFHIDPTHKKGYHIRSFDYFVPGTKLGDEYGYYSEKRWKFIEEPHYDRKGNVIVKLTPMKKE